MKKIAIITATRAEYGLFTPILKAIVNDPELEYHLVVTGTHLSEEFGSTIAEIENDGFEIHAKLDVLNKEDTGASMAKYLGQLTKDLADDFESSRPDILLLLGDRGEMLAAAITASCMNIGIIHLHGGETTGNIDNHFRNSISKLAHYHLVATEKNKKNLTLHGEGPDRIQVVGAPGLDIEDTDLMSTKETVAMFKLDTSKPIVLFVQHPVSTEIEQAGQQIKASLDALVELELQTIILYPNVDPGGRKMIETIKEYLGKYDFLQGHKSLPRSQYLSLMNISSVMAGNSSSGIIEALAFDLPVINIGNRQGNREQAENIINVPSDKGSIIKAIEKALHDTEFIDRLKDCQNPYGKGRSGVRIINILKDLEIDEGFLQKKYGE